MEEAIGESTASSSFESEGRHSSSSVSYGSGEKCRRERERDMFLGGGARTAYSLRKRLRRSLDDTNGVMVGVCKQCSQALAKMRAGFQKLKQQGSELKKRKKRYPAPKRANGEHYRDLVAQNAWIRNNIFDAMGNYIFCHSCVIKALVERLAQ